MLRNHIDKISADEMIKDIQAMEIGLIQRLPGFSLSMMQLATEKLIHTTKPYQKEAPVKHFPKYEYNSSGQLVGFILEPIVSLK